MAGIETSNSALKARRRIAEALMMRGMETGPVQHWTQGLARVAQSMLGGYELNKIGETERDQERALGEALAQSPVLRGASPNLAAPAAPATPSVASGPDDWDRKAGSPLARIASALSGGGSPGPQRNPTLSPETEAAAALPMGRPPVQSSPSVIGDEEGVKLGIYDPPVRPGMAPPVQPDAFNQRFAAAFPQSAPVAPSPVAPPALPAAPVQTAQMPPQGMPQPPVATDAAGQVDQQTATYIRGLIAGPRATPQTRAYGMQLLSQYGKSAQPTDEMREYNLYRQQGGRDSFFNYKAGLKRAGATQTQVQIDQRGEGEFAKESGKLQAKRYGDLAEDGMAARQMLSDIDTLRTLGAQIGTGKGAQVKAALGPYAQSLGVDIKGLEEIQAYEAIVNRLAPNLRVKGSGAQSDFELRNFLKSLPSIGNTAGGNEIAARVLEGLFQNKLAAAEIGARALNGELSRTEAEKALRAMPDPMKEYRDFIKRSNPAAAEQMQGLRQKYGLE